MREKHVLMKGLNTVRLTYRIKAPLTERILNAEDVFLLIMQEKDMRRNVSYKELMYAIYLNTACYVIGTHKVSEGCTDHADVNVKEILQGAILTNSSKVVICHNHPSTSLEPSLEDRLLSDRLRLALELVGIELLDSVIISACGYYSIDREEVNPMNIIYC